jgi:hypothetical protein
MTFLDFIHSLILLIISCVIHGFLALLLTFQTESLIVSNTHFGLFSTQYAHPFANDEEAKNMCFCPQPDTFFTSGVRKLLD